MKKSRLIFTAMAVVLTLGTFQVEAQKSAVRQRFDDSLARVKKCFDGKCTRMEAVKAGRDLGIAAGVVIAGMYVSGGFLKKVATVQDPWTGEEYITDPKVYQAGKQLQRPGRAVGRAKDDAGKAFSRAMYGKN